MPYNLPPVYSITETDTKLKAIDAKIATIPKGDPGEPGAPGEPGPPADLSNYYTKAEVDALIAAEPDPGPDPGPGPGPGPGPSDKFVDLVVTKVTYTPPAPKTGDPVTFKITVKNQGGAAIAPGTNFGTSINGGSQVLTWANHNEGLDVDAQVVLDTVTGLWPGGPWTPQTAGTVELAAIVDDTGLVPEGNEQNNTLAVSVAVAQGPPPPVVTPGKYFKASSTWNTKIPAGATFVDEPALRSQGWWVNASDYGLPVVVSKPTDPIVSVQCPGTWGYPATTLQLHIPAGGVGATGTDGTMVLVDGNTSYDFWQFRRNGNTASCSAWAKADIVNGDGWGSLNPFLAAGIHACGSSCLAGLVMREELKTGFSHALALSAHGTLIQPPPARVGQAISGTDGVGGPLIYSQRFGIPPNVAMPGSITSTPARMLWKAMQEYGAFLIDVHYGDRAASFGCDTACDPADIAVLLQAPGYNTVELNAIGAATRRVQ